MRYCRNSNKNLTKITSDYMDAGYKAIKIHVKFNYNH